MVIKKLVRGALSIVLIGYNYLKMVIVVLSGSIPLFWFKDIENFGDALNVYLVKKMTKRSIIWVNPRYYLGKNYVMIGSIISHANTKSVIWGSGYISVSSKFINPPQTVLAVRGPNTRKKLLDDGVDCPEILGDPALLLPRFYAPTVIKKYKVGIIPHYVDKSHEWIMTMHSDPSVNVINVETNKIEEFIYSVLQCDVILSTSLHGLIVADAYNIPSLWIRLSDEVVGGDFKFQDYFRSIDKNIEAPISCNATTSINDLMGFVSYEKVSINTQKLYESFPIKVL